MVVSCILEIITAFWSLFLGSLHLSGRLAEEKLGTWLLPSSQTDTPLPRDGFFYVTFVFRLCREIQLNFSQCLILEVKANPTSQLLIRTATGTAPSGQKANRSANPVGIKGRVIRETQPCRSAVLDTLSVSTGLRVVAPTVSLACDPSWSRWWSQPLRGLSLRSPLREGKKNASTLQRS